MKTLIVAGTWDEFGGKESGLMKKLYKDWTNFEGVENTVFLNGGYYNDLENIINTSKNYDVVFWMAYVPNNLSKVRDVKKVNPYALVIGSKRNNNEYSFVEVLNRALEQRHNLTIQFSRNDNMFEMLVFDPLGTKWFKGADIHECVKAIHDRIEFLLTTTRRHVYKENKENVLLNNPEFFEYVRECSEIFQETIEHAQGVTRFLGNASFRDKEYIYMSERDVDKSLIDENHFIATYLKDEKAYYLGDKKPSKDTVTQLNLYNKLPNINYIVHSHCYAQNAPFTSIPVPCGALEEITEVMEVIKNNYRGDKNLDYYAINLKGHGCLILGKTLELMKQTKFIIRHLPETL